MNTLASQNVARPNASSHMAFAGLVLASSLMFWRTLATLAEYSLSHQDSASHTLLIPLVSCFLLFIERERIFLVVQPSAKAGLAVILSSGVLAWLSTPGMLRSGTGSLSIATMALAIVWAGGFLGVYGPKAMRAGWFPLFFLLLMVPLPEAPLAWTIHLLQQGSTAVSYHLFTLLGVPVLRHGFVLALPTVTIEVAAECSGIRSSIALFIVCLLAAHLYLRTPWKIILFLSLVFPLVVIKNGIRIVTLTLLAVYVDRSFLYGRLHHQGGIVFFLIAMLLLFPVFRALEKSEGIAVFGLGLALNHGNQSCVNKTPT